MALTDRMTDFETLTGRPLEGTPSHLLLSRAAIALVRIADRFEITTVQVETDLGIFKIGVHRVWRSVDQAPEKVKRFLKDRAAGFPDDDTKVEL